MRATAELVTGIRKKQPDEIGFHDVPDEQNPQIRKVAPSDPSGWNYNSRDWLSSTFIGPGAPRGYWAGVELTF